MNEEQLSQNLPNIQKQKIVSIARFLMLFLIIGLPLFVLPGIFSSLHFTKVALTTYIVLFVSLFLVYRSIKGDSLNLSKPKSFLFYVPLLLPLTYGISLINAPHKDLSSFGYGVETDTVLAVLVFSLVAILIPLLFSTKKNIKLISVSILSVFSLTLIYQFIKFFVPQLSIWGAIPTNIDSLAGRWTDLAIISSFVVFGLVGLIESKKTSKVLNIASYVLLVLAFFVIGVSNFIFNFGTFFVSLPLVIIGLLVLRLFLVKNDANNNSEVEGGVQENSNNFSFVPTIIAILLSASTILFNLQIDNFASSRFGVLFQEGRPSWGLTIDIAKQVIARDGVLGSGPSTFVYNWYTLKPQAFNVGNPFWSIEFTSGMGYVPTAFSTIGIPGLIAWVVLVFSTLILILKLLFKRSEDGVLFKNIRVGLGVSLFISLLSIVTYVPNYTVLFTFFSLYGLGIATLVAVSVINRSEQETLDVSSKKIKIRKIVNTIIFVCLVFSVVEYSRIIISSVMANSAVISVQKGDFLKAKSKIENALKIKNLPVFHSIAGQIDFLFVNAYALGQEGYKNLSQEEIKNLIASSIAKSVRAESLEPENISHYYATAQILTRIGTLGAPEGYTGALIKHAEIFQKTPNSPIPLLLSAEVFIAEQKFNEAKLSLEEALKLKPDLIDAYVALARISAQQNRLTEARGYLDKAIEVAPQNINLRYERGLDRYNRSAYESALEDFNTILSLNPQVANARYFRALALYELGETDQALQELKAIQVNNQDNEELKKAIENIESGSLNQSKEDEESEDTEEETNSSTDEASEE